MIKGHAVLDEFTLAVYLGEDPVDAIYLGETKIWPSSIFEMDILYMPDEDD